MQKIVYAFLFAALALSSAHAQQPAPAEQDHGLKPYLLNSEGVLTNDPKGPIARSRVLPPHLLHYQNLKFPRGEKKNMTCIFSGVVDVQGKLQELQSTDCADPAYEHNAEQALKKYSFRPATLDDKPTPMQIKIEVRFSHL